MIDPLKPQDSVVVVALITVKEDTYVGMRHSSRDVRTFASNHFQNLIALG